jgi:hypothetical protein
VGTYGLENVILAWGRGDLTVEQAVGQILLLLQELEERLRIMEHRLEQHKESVRLWQSRVS